MQRSYLPGIDRKRIAGQRLRIIEIAAAPPSFGEIGDDPRIERRKRHRVFKVSRGRAQVTLLKCDRAEKVPCLGVIRITPQYPLCQRIGVAQPSGVKVRNGLRRNHRVQRPGACA